MDTEKAWKEFRANDSEQVVKSSTAAMLEAILSQQNALNAKLDLMRNDGAEPPEGGADVPPMPPMDGAPPMGGEEEGGAPPAEGAETMPPMDATALMGGIPENLGGTEPPGQMPPAGEGGTAPAVDDGAMPPEMPPMDDTDGAEPTPDIDKNSIMDLFKGDNSPFNTQDDGYDPNIGAITDAITNMTDPGIQLSMTNVLQEYLSKKLGGSAPEASPEMPVDEGAEPSVPDELLLGGDEAPSEDAGAISDIIDEIANTDAAPMDESADEMPPEEGTVDLPPETEEESPEEEKTSDDDESEKEEDKDKDEEPIKKSAKSDDDKKDEEEESSKKEEDKADDKDKDKGNEKSEKKPKSKKGDDSSESFADKFFSTDDDKKSEEKSDDAPVSDDEDIPDEEIDIEEEPLEESDVAAIEEVIGKKMSELIDTVREMLGGEADTDVNPMVAEGTVDLNPGTDPFYACDTPEAMDSLTRSIDDLMNDRLKGLRGYDGKMYKVVKSEAEIKREKTEQLKRSLGSKAVYHMTGEEVLNAINGLTGGDLETIKKSVSYLYPYDVIVRSLDTKIGSDATDRFLKTTVSFKKSPAFTLQDMIKANQEQYRKNSSYIPLTTIDLADMSQFNPASMDDETKKLFNALIYNILLADYNINRYGENGDFEKISYTKKPWAKYFQTNKPKTTTEGEVVEPEYYGSNDESKGMMTQRMIDLIDKKADSGELDFLDKDENSGITPASLYAAIENNSFNDVYKPYDDAVKIAEALKDKGIDIGSEEAILLPYLESLGGRFKYMVRKYGDKRTLTGYLTETDKNKGVLQYLNPTVFKEFASKVDPDKPYESLDGLVKGGAGNRLVDRYVYRGPGSRKPIATNGGSYNYYDPASIKGISSKDLMRRSIVSGMVPDLRRLIPSVTNDYKLPENPRTLENALEEYDSRDIKKDKEIGFDPSAGITNLKKGTKYTGEYGTPKTSDGEESLE